MRLHGTIREFGSVRDDAMTLGGARAPGARHASTVGGVELRRGSRVRLRPRARGDVFDLALAGQGRAWSRRSSEDMEGSDPARGLVEDDPGRDLGERRQPGHRFFFSPDEVEPLARAPRRRATRVLVAGIGNVFLGDDGFGVAVAGRLAARELPAGVEVVDFGIRGMDLAYALGEGYDAAVLRRRRRRAASAPGTLYVIEPELERRRRSVARRARMDPVKVLALARALGARAPRGSLVVGCEPQTRMTRGRGRRRGASCQRAGAGGARRGRARWSSRCSTS